MTSPKPLNPNTRWLLGFLLALLLALPAGAAPTNPVADVENRFTKLVFYPVIENYKHIILTVTGPCNFEYRDLIKEGNIGVFTLNEETIDGIYRYSLVAVPNVDEEILEVLQQARKYDEYSEVNALCREGALPGAPLNQSGGVLVAQGKIQWDPDLVEDRGVSGASAGDDGLRDGGFPLKDFVINDDLIVDGSACIGFDCVNGEVFGFDTLRLKENNLRIHFDDTSVVPSFPANDWTIVANDSANGGASKFSIEDRSGSRTPFTIEANARSHSLYVDDGGRIGSRTSTPSTEIHTIDGDTPTLRLQQDGSSGFEPQTWDVAGNETNFFIRDVTNGSTLPFRIRPGAPTSAIFIDVDGDVGFGTASPDAQLHIRGRSNDTADVIIEDTQASGAARDLLYLSNQGNPRFALENRAFSVEWFHGVPTTDYEISLSGSGVSEFLLSSGGDLTIAGEITTSGSCSVGCDRVFSDEYEVESIEEHATFMWENSYLRGVGPTPEGKPMNITAKTEGLLNELEKAHIYIEQLHNRLAALESRLEQPAE